MTNTSSEFGKELDSLADAITFGVAPSLLALIWGFHFLPDSINPQLRERSCSRPGLSSVFCFSSAACRAWRASTSATMRSRAIPGRPDRKYFVGMPIPAAAGLLASTVHFCYGIPVQAWWVAHSLDGSGGAHRIPDGQYLAVLVGQGDQLLAQPSLPDPVSAGDRDLCHGAVFARCLFRNRAGLHVLWDLGARSISWSRRRRQRPGAG